MELLQRDYKKDNKTMTFAFNRYAMRGEEYTNVLAETFAIGSA